MKGSLSPRRPEILVGPLHITLVRETLVSTTDAFLLQPSPVRPPAAAQVAQPTREPGESLPPLTARGTQQGFLALGDQKAQGFFGIKHKLEKRAEEGSQGSLGVGLPSRARPVGFRSQLLQNQCCSLTKTGIRGKSLLSFTWEVQFESVLGTEHSHK